MSFTMDKDGHEIEMSNDRDWGLEILSVKCPYKEQNEAVKLEVSSWCENCMESCGDCMLGGIKRTLGSSEFEVKG